MVKFADYYTEVGYLAPGGFPAKNTVATSYLCGVWAIL